MSILACGSRAMTPSEDGREAAKLLMMYFTLLHTSGQLAANSTYSSVQIERV